MDDSIEHRRRSAYQSADSVLTHTHNNASIVRPTSVCHVVMSAALLRHSVEATDKSSKLTNSIILSD